MSTPNPSLAPQSVYTVSPSEVLWYLKTCLKAGNVPSLIGPPGIGKTALVYQLGEQTKLKVIDIALTAYEPPDVNGILTINKDTDRGAYIPMECFPLEDDPLPDGCKGWILFFDEAPNADSDMQKALFKIVHDRMIGSKKLHPKCFIILAGNNAEDSQAANEYFSPLKSRVIHIFMGYMNSAFLEWARKNNIDNRITSYCEWRPANAYTFSPNSEDCTYTCPRTWEKLSKMIAGQDIADMKWLPLIAGTIGRTCANEFYQFCKIHMTLLTTDQIVNDPIGVAIPTKPDELIATVCTMGERATQSNVLQLLTFLKRLGGEYQLMAMNDICQRSPDLEFIPEVAQWQIDTGRRYRLQ